MKAIIPVLSCLLLSSCHKDSPVVKASETVSGTDYYPTITGKYVIYDVDSVVYVDLPRDTNYFHYQIKELIADSYDDNGTTNYRLERYTRKSDKDAWKITSVSIMNSGAKGVQVVENNARVVKIALPLTPSLSWNGNAYNNGPAATFSVVSLDNVASVGNSKLETLVISEQNDVTLIAVETVAEKYGKSIGLIERHVEKIYSNQISPVIPVKDRIESGMTYHQVYVTHGYQ